MQILLPLVLTWTALTQSIKLPFIRSNFKPQKTIGGKTYGSLWSPECNTVPLYSKFTIVNEREDYVLIETDLYSNPCHTLTTIFQYNKTSTQITLTLLPVKADNSPAGCVSDALPWKNMTGTLEFFANTDSYKHSFPFLLEAGNDQIALKFETNLKYAGFRPTKSYPKMFSNYFYELDDEYNRKYFGYGVNICILDPTTLALKSGNIDSSATRAVKHLNEKSYHSSVVKAFTEFSDTGKVEQQKPNDWIQLFKAAVEQKADKLQGISLSGLLSENIEKNLQVSGWKNIISESSKWGDFIHQVNNALPYNLAITVVPIDEVVMYSNRNCN